MHIYVRLNIIPLMAFIEANEHMREAQALTSEALDANEALSSEVLLSLRTFVVHQETQKTQEMWRRHQQRRERDVEAEKERSKFSKLSSLVTLYSRYTRALTFQSFC